MIPNNKTLLRAMQSRSGVIIIVPLYSAKQKTIPKFKTKKVGTIRPKLQTQQMN